jgi:iron-sulfur cluster repair protein YtfE (RIC family)
MARGFSFVRWGIIGGLIAGGTALIGLIPVMKKRAMRVTTILKKDHRVVSGLIGALQMTPRLNGMVRKTLLDRLRNNLLVHAQAEEEILYPAMRDYMIFDGQSKIDESYRQHQQIKDLVRELEAMDPVTDAFDHRLLQLKSEIRHHVEKEEGEMFPILVQRMSTDQQEELGHRIHARKGDLKPRIAA